MPDLTAFTPTASEWDAFLDRQPEAHLLQTSAWASLKCPYGWDCLRVALRDQAGTLAAGAQILLRSLPFRLGHMAYLPMGPVLTHFDQRQPLWDAIHAAARRRAAFLKWEPGILPPGAPPPDTARFGFQPSPQTVQPPRTILIDLTGGEDAILARMNQGTRRKIRQSQKHGIRFWQASREDVPLFTGMMQTTGARNAFGVHAPAYYALAFDLFVPDHAALILAAFDGEPLAGVMVFARGSTAWYLYGASSGSQRNLMAPYGVQWMAIQWALQRGCAVYDMWGIPDADEPDLEAQFESRSDGLWGVYGFKRGWGGQVVRGLGAFDRVYNPVVYAAYRAALRVRRSAE
jgi:lipid II:glycine glycyltransferase (peptidoglycan interpeptide bridge formation enzyme)